MTRNGVAPPLLPERIESGRDLVEVVRTLGTPLLRSTLDITADRDPEEQFAAVLAKVGEEWDETLRGWAQEDGKPLPPPPEHAFPLLRELLNDPELLRPPPQVLPRLANHGRTTGLVAPDKAGKSTLTAHGVATLTNRGVYLGERVKAGKAVIAAPDEALGDTVRRLGELGADPDSVRILTLRPPDLLATLETTLSAHPADLVVVDSLAEWARLTLGRAPEDGDASGWGAVVRPLVQVSREHDCAVLLLHHPRRSDGQYRGSGEIAAALDCLLEMTMPQSGEDPTLRRFRGRARWPVEDFTIHLQEDRFVLGGTGELPLEARILLDTRTHPGTNRTAQHQRLGGRKQNHVSAVNQLLERGALVERGGGLHEASAVEEDLL